VIPIPFQFLDPGSCPPKMRKSIIASSHDQRQGSSRNPCAKKFALRLPRESMEGFHEFFFIGCFYRCQNSEREAVCSPAW
jgi:hypothetical protein